MKDDKNRMFHYVNTPKSLNITKTNRNVVETDVTTMKQNSNNQSTIEYHYEQMKEAYEGCKKLLDEKTARLEQVEKELIREQNSSETLRGNLLRAEKKLREMDLTELLESNFLTREFVKVYKKRKEEFGWESVQSMINWILKDVRKKNKMIIDLTERNEYLSRENERFLKYPARISPEKISRIKQLSREGYSQRGIAKKTGVSLATVNRYLKEDSK